MRTQILSWAVYLIVCMVVPFLWGLLIHWIFNHLSERRRALTPSRVREDAGRTVWDYHI